MRTEDVIGQEQSLIVSYSYSGNTHRIAEALRHATGSDWCEIYPRQPYPMAFPELLTQAKKEIQTRFLPRLLPVSLSPRPYSRIFVGSPNWCGSLAPPIAAWLHQNDLTGKIILPFYSHCGGVPCDMQQAIQKLCPRAEVHAAMGVLDTAHDGLDEQIIQWLTSDRAFCSAGFLKKGRLL